MGKLKSRKFWITVAMLFGGVATTISGLGADDEILAIVGIACSIIAGCIYNLCETMVDCEEIIEEHMQEE